MFRNYRQRATLAPVVALLGVMLLGVSGAAGAASTRTLYVGDPNQVSNPPNPYEIHPTPVSAGQYSYFDVEIKNGGKQTLTGAELAMGTLIAGTDGTNIGKPLPSGWKITNIVYQSGITPTCVTDPSSVAPSTGLITAGSYDGFSCGFGNLSARTGYGTIRVYLFAGPDLSAASDIQVSGKVAENTGGNVGSNTNTFYAYGSGNFWVSGDGRIAGLFDKNSGPVSPLAPTGTITSVDLFALTSTSQFVVSIDETTTSPTCPTTITTCSTGSSTVHVNQGLSVSPYFVWIAQFPVSSSYKLSTKTGFIHFFETYDPNDPQHSSDYETFYAVNKTSCSKPSIPCADFTLVNGGTSSAYVQVYFETARNGSGKLF